MPRVNSTGHGRVRAAEWMARFRGAVKPGRGCARECKSEPLARQRQPILWRLLLLLGIGVLATLGGEAAQGGATGESGVFQILSGERRVGTETFKITPGPSGWEVAGELQLEMAGAPRMLENCSLRLSSGFHPISYQRQQKSPKKGDMTAQFGPSETKLVTHTEAGTQEQIFYLPGNHLVVLDTNFFHHYSLLLRQFDFSQPGPQSFNVFIPQEATPGIISLQFQGKENQVTEGAQRELNHFQVVAEQLKMDIWATPEGEIFRISIPQANLEIVRQQKR